MNILITTGENSPIKSRELWENPLNNFARRATKYLLSNFLKEHLLVTKHPVYNKKVRDLIIVTSH